MESAGALEAGAAGWEEQGTTGALRTEGEPLFVVLDAARDPAVLELLRRGGQEHQMLYAGRRGEHLAAVAPYLVRLPPGSPLLDALLERGRGASWGVYLTCDLPFAEVRRHLRRFLVAETEDGQALYFRFYDPRVLRPYLPSCTPAELGAFFGPVSSFWVEGASGRAAPLLRFTRPGPAPAAARRGLWMIRDAQVEVFSREVVEVFVDRMVERLERDFPGELARWGEAPRGDLRRTIRAGIDRAEGYGLSREREVLRFVDLMARLGPSFDERLPWAAEILRRGDLAAAKKTQHLERRRIEEQSGE